MSQRLPSIRFRTSAAHGDTLLLSLDAILRAFGAEVELDSLAEALHTPGANSDDARTPAPDAVARRARADRIVEAARKWGLELRDLHPPEAAPIPVAPPEFEQHFRDSYMPFIRSALDRGDPVLAWMGWPPPDDKAWGIVTGIDKYTGRCVGRTPTSPDSDLVMIGPAVQVYSIER